MINLHEIAKERGYRKSWDESRVGQERDPWLMTIPGKFGHVYVHGEQSVACAVDAVRRFRRLQATVAGVEVIQLGDDGANATFPLDQLDEVAKVLKLKKRRQLSPDARAAATERIMKLHEERRKTGLEIARTGPVDPEVA